MELQGRVAVVTGANGGLGRRLAEGFARAGCDVALVCRTSIEETQSVADGLAPLGVRSEVFAADLADPAEVARLEEEVVEAFGRVDVLVSNAAINRFVPFTDLEALTPEIWSEIIDNNVSAPFLVSRAFAPALSRDDGGRIVNISSIAGFAPLGSSIAYAVAKAGLNHLTRCLAVALAPGVLVNGIAPGHLPGTRMSGNLPAEHRQRSIESAALGRATSLEDVVDQAVVFARSDSTTGQTLCVDAGRHYH